MNQEYLCFPYSHVRKTNALSMCVFKSKYIPKGDFIGATLGNNSSYTWQSILSSKIVLKEGVMWKMGSGANIHVWDEPWLRDKESAYIRTPTIKGLEDLRVRYYRP